MSETDVVEEAKQEIADSPVVRVTNIESVDHLMQLAASYAGRHSYVWRGQPDQSYSLRSSLARLLVDARDGRHCAYSFPDHYALAVTKHERRLISKIVAVMPKVGIDPSPYIDEELRSWLRTDQSSSLDPLPVSAMQLLALGQHHGLKTNLLDWTSSIGQAIFFAISVNIGHGSDKPDAAVWGLPRHAVLDAFEAYREELDSMRGMRRSGGVVYSIDKDQAHGSIDPLPYMALRMYSSSDVQNRRLFSQRGEFTHLTPSYDLEHALARIAETLDKDKIYTSGATGAQLVEHARLDKLVINCELFNRVGTVLAAMNIGWHTLMPDIEGAMKQANLMELVFELQGW